MTGTATAETYATHPDELKSLFGMRFLDQPPELIARQMLRDARSKTKRLVFFVNAHCANVAFRNERYAELMKRQPHVFADGVGMRLASKLAGNEFTYNVNGTDLFPRLCAEAEKADVAIALIGAREGITDLCVEKLNREYPSLRIVWHRHGFMGPEEERQALRELNATDAGLLFVAKGVPVQEYWIEEHADQINVPVILGVGALFDFVSGKFDRAPRRVRKLGMEWLFRLYLEPKRLFRRYVLGNPLFILRTLRAFVRGHLKTALWRA